MARLHKISGLLAKELDVLELEEQINSQVQQGVDRANREHYLREQMRVIQGELGELDIFSQEHLLVVNGTLPPGLSAHITYLHTSVNIQRK